MYHKPSKQKQLLKQIVVYAVMTLAVFVIATFIIFFVMGFRFNLSDGRIEQYAFLQYASSPSGASVSVDGQKIGSTTPTKSSIPEGKHNIVISRDGYKDWTKTVDVKSGTITWLNYALLVPQKLDVESVVKYEGLYDSLASIEGQKILTQDSSSQATFGLVDVASDQAKNSKIVIPATIYSQSGVAGVKHVFTMNRWDDGGRYVLIKHVYDKSTEWLVFDTQDVSRTKNITKLFNISFESIYFSGTSGNTLYALDGGDIRKLDLSAETISKPLVSNVLNFSLYNDKVIAYLGKDSNSKFVGIYRDGDSQPYIFRKVSNQSTYLQIATSRYFNEDYVAIAEGQKIDIMRGSYPNGSDDASVSMKTIANFDLPLAIDSISFSPTGQYVLIKSGSNYTSYDLEYQTTKSSEVDGNSDGFVLEWLDDNYLWSDRDSYLTIREFDGANISTINSVAAGQDVLLTHNGRYLYSFNKLSSGYQLQRVRMILP